MTIRLKIILAIVGALALFIVSNLATHILIKETNKTIALVVDVNGERLNLLNSLTKEASKREVQLLNLVLLDPDADNYSEKSEAIQAKLKIGATQIASAFNKLNEFKLEGKEKEVYEEVKVTMQSANTAFSSFMIAVNEGFQDEAGDIMREEFSPKYTKFAGLINELQTTGKEKNRVAIENLYKEQENSLMYLMIGTVLTILIFTLGGYFIGRSILNPIQQMESTMLEIVKTGDMKHRIAIRGKDEIASTSKAVNALLEDISRTVECVNKVLRNTALGNFEQRVEFDLKGDFLKMKNEVNGSVSQIQSIVSILETTAQNFRSGDLQVHKDDSVQLEGKFQSVLYDLDRSAIRMKDNVKGIAQTLDSLAHGDFAVRVDIEARGDFIPLKDSLNITLSDLETFVNEVARVQEHISQGDLTYTVDGSYSGKMHDLQESLNSSVKNTAVLVAKVESITQSVSMGVDDIAEGNGNINERVRQQSAAIEDTSASMEEMTNAVKQNAASALQAKDKTAEAQQQLEVGLQTMQQALSSMDQMAEANNKINEITSLIDGIAFQTNLLALNAAVEAARAGEHGRGFAVVAGEVRSLAGKSADAAGEIKHLIENSVKVSQESGRYVRNTSDALAQINESMQIVGNMVADISETSEEQAHGVEHVNQAIHTMDEMTQGNAEIVQTATDASQSLLDNTVALKEQVNQFTIDSHVPKSSMVLIAQNEN